VVTHLSYVAAIPNCHVQRWHLKQSQNTKKQLFQARPTHSSKIYCYLTKQVLHCWCRKNTFANCVEWDYEIKLEDICFCTIAGRLRNL